jgi:hypothetical protein
LQFARAISLSILCDIVVVARNGTPDLTVINFGKKCFSRFHGDSERHDLGTVEQSEAA